MTSWTFITTGKTAENNLNEQSPITNGWDGKDLLSHEKRIEQTALRRHGGL